MSLTTPQTMKWASGMSAQPSLEKAVQECASAVKRQLDGQAADLVAVFVSAGFSDRYEEAAKLVLRDLSAKTLIGCSAGGVIGAGRELEHKPGVSLVAASLPDVVIKPFSLQAEDLPDMDASPRAWENRVGVKSIEAPQFIVLADPFSFPSDDFLMGLDYTFPKSTKVGGLASGGSRPGENALYMNTLCLRGGLVGAALMGNIQVEAIVTQGCKPIGDPLIVTDCDENILLALNHEPPLQVLQKVALSLDERDRRLIQHSLFVGLAMDPGKKTYERGDFLIRNIIGADGEKGILAVGARLRKGQTVQFHLRDAEASADDLSHLLARSSRFKDSVKGALLFSCLGRGQHLYGRPDHDTQMFERHLGAVPVGGFFCNGEIGPVAGTTYLHGYTSCFGLFHPRRP